jgi:phage-related holin
MIYAPLILMLVDYVTGVLNAWLKKEIKSYKMRIGLAKKCGEIIAIGLGEFF